MGKTPDKTSDKTATVTFRIDPEKRAALDTIASGLDRDRSYVLNEAVDNYIDLHKWQVEHIKKALLEVKAGKFVPEEEMEAFFEESKRRLEQSERKTRKKA